MGAEIFGMVGGMMNAGINYSLNQRANQESAAINYNYGEMAANAADRRTRALYNDLYSPAAKMRQLREAGLSPGLMYGMAGAAGGSTSTAGAMGQGAGNQQGKANNVDLLQYALMGKQARLLDAQAENESAQAAEHNANAEKTAGVDTQKTIEETKLLAAQIDNENVRNGILKATERFENVQAQIAEATSQQQIDKIINESKLIYEEYRKALADADVAEQTKEELIKQASLQTQLLIKQILVADTQAKLNQAQAKAVLEQAQAAMEQALAAAVNAETNERVGEAQIQWFKDSVEAQLAGVETSTKNAIIGSISQLIGQLAMGLGFAAGRGAFTSKMPRIGFN